MAIMGNHSRIPMSVIDACEIVVSSHQAAYAIENNLPVQLAHIKIICPDQNIDFKKLVEEEIEHQEQFYREERRSKGYAEYNEEKPEIVVEEDMIRSKRAGQMFSRLYSQMQEEKEQKPAQPKSPNEEKSNFVTDFSERRGPRRY